MAQVKFAELVRRAKESDGFWAERAALEFTVDLNRLLSARNFSRADLARKLGTSQAYITKVLRGDVNFTIDSMVKLARAVEGRLHIHVANNNHRVRWLDVVDCKRQNYLVHYKVDFDKPVKVQDTHRDGNLPLAA